MDGQTDKLANGQTYKQRVKHANKWTNGCTGRQMNRHGEKLTNGWTDRQAGNGHMTDRQTDKL